MKLHQETHETNGVLPSDQRVAPYQELLGIIGRRKRRILFTVVLALGLAALFCVWGGPWFDSNAQLLVIRKKLDTAPISGPDQARAQEDYLSTHMLLMTSRRVIVDAIKRGNLQDLQQFRGGGGGLLAWLAPSAAGDSEKATERIATEIIESLGVTRDVAKPGISPSNEIINLSFRGRVAADGPRILNAIIDSYQAFLKETYRNTNAEALELITQARDLVQKDLKVKEAAYQKFLAETPPLWKGQDKNTAHQERLFKIDAKLSALRVRRAELEAAIETIDNAVKAGRNPTALIERMFAPSAVGAVGAADPLANQAPAGPARRPGASLEEELLNLQVQEGKLLALRAPNHPDVVAVRQQIDTVRRMLLPSGEAEGAHGKGTGTALAKLKIELLKQELDELKLTERSLATLFDEEKKGVSASYLHEIQDDTHRKAIERDRLLYDGILNRLKETSSVRDFGGYNTQVIGPALHGRLALRKYLLIFGLAVFVGLFGGLAWAYLLEASARKAPAAAPVSRCNAMA
jgi:uncharacterized protein involved in exopolysaccharide biosynthesis